MIESEHVVRELIDAAPSIGSRWEQHVEFWDGEPAGYYNDLAELAHHLVALVAQGKNEEVQSVFIVVERLLGSELSVDTRGRCWSSGCWRTYRTSPAMLTLALAPQPSRRFSDR